MIVTPGYHVLSQENKSPFSRSQLRHFNSAAGMSPQTWKELAFLHFRFHRPEVSGFFKWVKCLK